MEIGEPDDGVSKAGGFPVMPEPPGSSKRIHAPAEAVSGCCAVRETLRREPHGQTGLVEQLGALERVTPLREVQDRRVDPAVAPRSAGDALVGRLEGRGR